MAAFSLPACVYGKYVEMLFCQTSHNSPGSTSLAGLSWGSHPLRKARPEPQSLGSSSLTQDHGIPWPSPSHAVPVVSHIWPVVCLHEQQWKSPHSCGHGIAGPFELEGPDPLKAGCPGLWLEKLLALLTTGFFACGSLQKTRQGPGALQHSLGPPVGVAGVVSLALPWACHHGPWGARLKAGCHMACWPHPPLAWHQILGRCMGSCSLRSDVCLLCSESGAPAQAPGDSAAFQVGPQKALAGFWPRSRPVGSSLSCCLCPKASWLLHCPGTLLLEGAVRGLLEGSCRWH